MFKSSMLEVAPHPVEFNRRLIHPSRGPILDRITFEVASSLRRLPGVRPIISDSNIAGVG
eukprot:2871712-Pyramimonas_sp.AAC.1